MNYFTNSIQKIKTNEYLFCELADSVDGQPLVVGPLQNFEEVNSQNFVDHTEMIAIWTFIKKAIEEVKDMGIISVYFFGLFAFILSNFIYPIRS